MKRVKRIVTALCILFPVFLLLVCSVILVGVTDDNDDGNPKHASGLGLSDKVREYAAFVGDTAAEYNIHEYEKYLLPKDDVSVMKLVKAADKISALIKCIEEEKTGNREFNHAKESTYKAIKNLGCDEADIFCKKFVPEYEKTLDELN